MIILVGDVGIGKIIIVEFIVDRMIRELKKEGYFLKLSIRVCGEGLYG